jgi:hypothetical protein
MWRPIAINATLVTSAAVANRIPGIQFQIYGVTTYVNDNSTAITASTTRTLVYQQGSVMVPTLQFTTFNVVCFLPQFLPPGSVINSLTGAIDVADQYSNINAIVEEVTVTDEQLTEFGLQVQLETLEEMVTAGTIPDQFSRIQEHWRPTPRG